MELRQATFKDIDNIEAMIEDAKERMRIMKIDQWQNGYPNRASILDDLHHNSLFVLVDKNTPVASTMIMSYPDPNYASIKGTWGSNASAITLHRLVTAQSHLQSGVASTLLRAVKELYPQKDIRIDTHKDNIPMKKMLLRNGFVYRGIINLADGAEREAYDFVHPSQTDSSLSLNDRHT